MVLKTLLVTPLVILSGAALDINEARAQQPTETTGMQVSRYGVGASISQHAGVSLYGDLARDNFVQGTIAANGDGEYAVTADYAFSYPNLITGVRGLQPYWGVGALAARNEQGSYFQSVDKAEEGDLTGVRVPFGINYTLAQAPVQLGGEIAPTFLINPSNTSFVQGGFNARILF